jgi:hypothetical protein
MDGNLARASRAMVVSTADLTYLVDSESYPELFPLRDNPPEFTSFFLQLWTLSTK